MTKKIPKFKNEIEEGEFWSTQDVTDYFDTTELESVSFPKLKPSTKTISIRLPEMILDSIKILANKRDVPYQSLIKTYLQEKIDREFHTKPA
ncbi:MAG: BrnA antitoxin family protein [SAR324 cluster bacterium]|nr:BrnA antitoxin family protein [SAR324 cluster bacterium]